MDLHAAVPADAVVSPARCAEPVVGVVMASYENASFLREAIDSVLAQTYSHWELVVVENGSGDGSAEIVRSYSDPRIRPVFLARNVGVTGAFNCGLAMSRGRYTAILDSDDVAEPDRFARQVDFLAAHPDIAIVGSRATMFGPGIDEHPSVPFALTHEAIVDSFADNAPMGHATVMYRTDVARQVGGYPVEFEYAQDCGFYLRLLAGGFRFANLEEPLLRSRVHPGQATLDPGWAMKRAGDALTVFRAAGRFLPSDPEVRARNRRKLASCNLHLARVEAGSGRAGATLQAVLAALACSPAHVLRTLMSKARP